MLLVNVAAALRLLLNAYWTLAAGAALVALLPVPLAESFRSAVLLTACRGKLWQTRPKARLGRLTDISVPQRWFLHFYVMGAIWNAVVLVADITQKNVTAVSRHQNAAAGQTAGREAASLLALLLLQFHLLRRAWETHALLRYPANARMHIIAYLFGLSYYLVLPVSLLPAAALDSLIPASTMSLKLPHLAYVLQHARLLCTLRYLLGAGLVVTGNVMQFKAHQALAGLSSALSTRKEEYRIPRGGAFELVSCPHYFAEIVIYAGFVVLLGARSVTVWLVFLWVAANLTIAANRTHDWYKTTFKTYPKWRRALVPWVY